MNIKRRHFLQFAGSALATLGLSQLELQNQGLRYGKVLAQDTPRKLALLIGINQYPKSNRFADLGGCVNDVKLQKYLLLNRFGFQEKDILTLTDEQATRQGILEAFEEHLIKQAKPGDVVVFHFSGHGSRVADAHAIHDDGYNSTFVPADDHPLAKEGIVNDITGKSLFLLMYALSKKTENITAVLDSCHSGGGTRGNVKVRAIAARERASQEELAYQRKWLKTLKLDRKELQSQRQEGIATGIVIASAQRDQYASDYYFPGFYAGAFTYLLTQYLWQNTTDVDKTISIIKNRLHSLFLTQEPLYEIQSNWDYGEKPVYLLQPEITSADAAIISTDGDRAKLWLGGIPEENIEAVSTGTIFTTLAQDASGSTQVELISRQGLVGEAILKGKAQPKALLQEIGRAIPKDWQLIIGIDPSLSEDAALIQEKLGQIKRVKAITSQSQDRTYSQQVHYILSRLTRYYQQDLLSSLGNGAVPPEGSIGLFSPSLEIISQSFGTSEENAEEAIERLNSKIKSLLAARIIKMTLNAQSSRLDVEVNMGIENSEVLIAEVFTPRGSCRQDDSYCKPNASRSSGQKLSHKVSVDELVQFQVINHEDIALYVAIVLVDPSSGLTVLFPNQYQGFLQTELEQASRIEAGDTFLIPDPNQDDFVLKAKELGIWEILVVASQKPLTNALLKLRNIAFSRGKRDGLLPTKGEESVQVVSGLLEDVSETTRSADQEKSEGKLLKTTEMAALSITFEVVS